MALPNQAYIDEYKRIMANPTDPANRDMAKKYAQYGGWLDPTKTPADILARQAPGSTTDWDDVNKTWRIKPGDLRQNNQFGEYESDESAWQAQQQDKFQQEKNAKLLALNGSTPESARYIKSLIKTGGRAPQMNVLNQSQQAGGASNADGNSVNDIQSLLSSLYDSGNSSPNMSMSTTGETDGGTALGANGNFIEWLTKLFNDPKNIKLNPIEPPGGEGPPTTPDTGKGDGETKDPGDPGYLWEQIGAGIGNWLDPVSQKVQRQLWLELNKNGALGDMVGDQVDRAKLQEGQFLNPEMQGLSDTWTDYSTKWLPMLLNGQISNQRTGENAQAQSILDYLQGQQGEAGYKDQAINTLQNAGKDFGQNLTGYAGQFDAMLQPKGNALSNSVDSMMEAAAAGGLTAQNQQFFNSYDKLLQDQEEKEIAAARKQLGASNNLFGGTAQTMMNDIRRKYNDARQAKMAEMIAGQADKASGYSLQKQQMGQTGSTNALQQALAATTQQGQQGQTGAQGLLDAALKEKGYGQDAQKEILDYIQGNTGQKLQEKQIDTGLLTQMADILGKPVAQLSAIDAQRQGQLQNLLGMLMNQGNANKTSEGNMLQTIASLVGAFT